MFCSRIPAEHGKDVNGSRRKERRRAVKPRRYFSLSYQMIAQAKTLFNRFTKKTKIHTSLIGFTALLPPQHSERHIFLSISSSFSASEASILLFISAEAAALSASAAAFKTADDSLSAPQLSESISPRPHRETKSKSSDAENRL